MRELELFDRLLHLREQQEQQEQQFVNVEPEYDKETEAEIAEIIEKVTTNTWEISGDSQHQMRKYYKSWNKIPIERCTRKEEYVDVEPEYDEETEAEIAAIIARESLKNEYDL